MEEKLNQLLDQGVISEEEHKRGMEANRLEYKDLENYEYNG